MVREVLEYLSLKEGITVVDGTVGAGGHSQKILNRIGPEGKLIGLDRDPMMLKLAGQVLTAPNCSLHQASYAELPEVLDQLNLSGVDRVLLDLGLSSDQLADPDRGFGFKTSGELDLRFDTSRGRPAWQLLAEESEIELARIFTEYGEERFSDSIASALVRERNETFPRTVPDLVALLERTIPRNFQQTARTHPATRIFQALRIAVNDELSQLQTALSSAMPDAIVQGGRIVILTFHSLEDRLVKQSFRGDQSWQNLTPRPVPASPTEQRINPRSRSAKLRAAIRT